MNYMWSAAFLLTGVGVLANGRLLSGALMVNGVAKFIFGFGFVLAGLYIIYYEIKKK